MKVKTLLANWHQNGNLSDGAGEDFDKYEIGVSGVAEIIEKEPQNGMQLHHFIVKYKDGVVVKVFNPNHVVYYGKR